MSAKILPITQVGEPVLRERARELTVKEIQSREIRDLIRDMRETMYKAPGVGLAAPQIGRALQLAVIEDKAEYMKDVPADVIRERERRPVPFQVIINPKITLLDQGKAEFFEGCLSLTGFTAVVSRARAVQVECLDEQGSPRMIEASGWYARILQHEIDHLGGTIYIDRMLPRTFMSVELMGRHWSKLPVKEALTRLDGYREA